MGTSHDYQVVGTFPDGDRARSAVEALQRRGLPRSQVRVVRPNESQRKTIVSVHIEQYAEADVVHRLLREAGATRIDPIDVTGAPMPPQSEHRRPADPPGWWERDESDG